jgi:DNA-binding response OmpR family regulator
MGKTILVVDDEGSQREEIRKILSRAGYKVLEAADYGMARSLHQQLHGWIDLLLVDASLPSGNGFELAQHMTAEDRNLRVLFMSAAAGAEILKFYGVSDDDLRYLRKPFRRAELVERVRQALERSEPASFSAGS